MASSRAPEGVKPKNKLRRQSAYQSIRKAREAAKRDERFRRKREEAKAPHLREERLARNVPATIDSKRIWDEGVGDEEDALAWSIDVERLAKKRKLEQETTGRAGDEDASLLAQLKKRDEEGEDQEPDDEVDSMLDSESEAEDGEESDSDSDTASKRKPNPPPRASSPATSTATNLELSPEFLKQKFPLLFETPTEPPKILVTTSLQCSKELHQQADILTSFFPNSTYIRRTAHAHAHKYSVREIAQFATNRSYTAIVIIYQDLHQKKPSGLDIVHLPSGPHCISNWVEGKQLPGHGNPTGHIPELILNNFRTPLGMLTAHSLKSLYPPQPELSGRTVVTLHNSRDYIFVRRHRYIFRDKRPSEKSIVNTDGKVVKGVEDLRVGMQELGPRFTLKLRRIDRGIQWKSGQEWEWKSRMEKQRTRFNM